MPIDIRALIFDMDGVIADTIDLHYRAWQRLAAEEHIAFTPEQYRRMQGITRPDALKIFLDGRPVNDSAAQGLMDRKNSYFLELLDQITDTHCKPGATDLIREARANGIKIGLGSSSRNAHRVLRKLALIDSFDAIADGTTVQRNKPAPDIFLWVAAQLGVEPVQGVVFEDSEAGVQAASKGGFWVVGIGQDYDSPPHLALQSLTDIDLDGLRERLGGFKAPSDRPEQKPID